MLEDQSRQCCGPGLGHLREGLGLSVYVVEGLMMINSDLIFPGFNHHCLCRPFIYCKPLQL